MKATKKANTAEKIIVLCGIELILKYLSLETALLEID